MKEYINILLFILSGVIVGLILIPIIIITNSFDEFIALILSFILLVMISIIYLFSISSMLNPI